MRENASTALAFDAIRERVLFAGYNDKEFDGALVVVLMSRTRGEGVTTVAAGLAKAFGRVGNPKILVVDANYKYDDLGRLLGLTDRVMNADQPEISVESPKNDIQRIDKYGLDLLTMEADPSGHSVYGCSWETFFAKLRSTYDIILVDAGSLQTQTPLIWSRWATQLLLVVDTSRTTVEALERLRKDLQHFPLVLTGVIMNKRRYPVPRFLYRFLH